MPAGSTDDYVANVRYAYVGISAQLRGDFLAAALNYESGSNLPASLDHAGHFRP